MQEHLIDLKATITSLKQEYCEVKERTRLGEANGIQM